MRIDQIANELRNSALRDNFREEAQALADRMNAENVGLESLEPILRFMEQQPSCDFGTPGPLTHYMEGFYGNGYEDKLVESIERKPTFQTIWMLNRVINSTRNLELREKFGTVLERARYNPDVEDELRSQIDHFIARL